MDNISDSNDGLLQSDSNTDEYEETSNAAHGNDEDDDDDSSLFMKSAKISKRIGKIAKMQKNAFNSRVPSPLIIGPSLKINERMLANITIIMDRPSINIGIPRPNIKPFIIPSDPLIAPFTVPTTVNLQNVVKVVSIQQDLLTALSQGAGFSFSLFPMDSYVHATGTLLEDAFFDLVSEFPSFSLAKCSSFLKILSDIKIAYEEYAEIVPSPNVPIIHTTASIFNALHAALLPFFNRRKTDFMPFHNAFCQSIASFGLGKYENGLTFVNNYPDSSHHMTDLDQSLWNLENHLYSNSLNETPTFSRLLAQLSSNQSTINIASVVNMRGNAAKIITLSLEELLKNANQIKFDHLKVSYILISLLSHMHEPLLTLLMGWKILISILCYSSLLILDQDFDDAFIQFYQEMSVLLSASGDPQQCLAFNMDYRRLIIHLQKQQQTLNTACSIKNRLKSTSVLLLGQIFLNLEGPLRWFAALLDKYDEFDYIEGKHKQWAELSLKLSGGDHEVMLQIPVSLDQISDIIPEEYFEFQASAPYYNTQHAYIVKGLCLSLNKNDIIFSFASFDTLKNKLLDVRSFVISQVGLVLSDAYAFHLASFIESCQFPSSKTILVISNIEPHKTPVNKSIENYFKSNNISKEFKECQNYNYPSFSTLKLAFTYSKALVFTYVDLWSSNNLMKINDVWFDCLPSIFFRLISYLKYKEFSNANII